MKAIVVRQPWATLIALGIKAIETRPGPPNGPMRPEGVRGLPGCSLEHGERIAIVAGATAPKDGAMGEWDVWTSFGSKYSYLRRPMPLASHRTGLVEYWLPLGAVVCTVVVDDALPMEPCPPYSSSFDDWWEPEPASVIYLGGLDGGPWMFVDGLGPYPLYDQLPLGDYTPGRWGWMLTDPQPPRVWHCDADAAGYPTLRCTESAPHGPECHWRTVDPIPCKGRQGVFQLPDDVAEALGGGL